MNISQFNEQIRAARTYLLMVYPFYASLVFRLKVIPSDELLTAGVNAKDELFINPAFFESLGCVERRAFLLAHEVLHPALGIFWRGRDHDPRISNAAHDYVINLILREENPLWVIPDCLLDDRFFGLCYEEVYGILKKGNKIPPQWLDVIWDGRVEGNVPETVADNAMRWRGWLMEGIEVARVSGRLPKGLDRFVKAVNESSVPWTEYLRLRICESLNAVTYSWDKVSRRANALNLYLPEEVSQGATVSVYVDTSGSISEQNLEAALREIEALVDIAGGTLRIFEGDASIHADRWIKKGEIQNFKGGGGTSFVPIFEHLESDPPNCLIIITDTFGDMPSFEPSYQVIWGVHKEVARTASIPFGEMVEIPA